MRQNKKIPQIKSRIQDLRNKRIEHAKRQLKLDRLEITLDGLGRYLKEREAEIVLEIWRNNQKNYPKVLRGVIKAEVTNRLAKDDVFYRRMKYHERLRRRMAKLISEQTLLSAEIEYLLESMKTEHE